MRPAESNFESLSSCPQVLEELDLVEDEEQITHEATEIPTFSSLVLEISDDKMCQVDLLDDTIKGEETLNIFKADDTGLQRSS